MNSKQFQLGFFAIISAMGLFVLIGIRDVPFTSQYLIKHQCDAAPDGYGDPNCYNYKDHFWGDYYPFEISKGIAERSGGDMERFCEYHKQVGKECIVKKTVSK